MKINSNNEWNESWAKSGDSIQILIESSEDLFDINALIQDNSSSISLISLDEYIVNYVFVQL